jgi:hypothetical protein
MTFTRLPNGLPLASELLMRRLVTDGVTSPDGLVWIFCRQMDKPVCRGCTGAYSGTAPSLTQGTDSATGVDKN